MKDQGDTIELRVLNISGRTAAEVPLLGKADEQGVKDKALEVLGIKRRPGEPHLDAWFKVLHEDNGYAYQKPAHPAIRDAVMSSVAANKTMWLLA